MLAIIHHVIDRNPRTGDFRSSPTVDYFSFQQTWNHNATCLSSSPLYYTPLGQHFLNNVAGDVGEAEVAALEAEGELEVVEAQEVEDGSVEVVDVDDVFDAVVADV